MNMNDELELFSNTHYAFQYLEGGKALNDYNGAPTALE